MKRIVAVLAVTLLFVCMQVTALAESRTINQTGESVSIDVKGIYVPSSDPAEYKEEVRDGSSSVTTESGITVSISADEQTFESGVNLVVREISEEETEAYSWFSDVLKEVGSKILPLDIYFEKDGQKVQVNSKVRVTITLPQGYNNPIICYVSSDGKVEVVPSTVENGKITFEVDHFSYYVLAESEESGGEPTGTGTTTSSATTATTKAETTTTGTTQKSDGAKTGEDTVVLPFLLLTAAFFVALYVSFAKKQRVE
jgi:hypothetical protein